MENRELANYYAETAEVDNLLGGTNDVYETITSFNLTQDRINVTFKGWNSSEAFATYTEDNFYLRRSFNPLLTDLSQEQQDLLNGLKVTTLEDILGVNPNDYDFVKVEINAEGLTGLISAKHKINRQFVHRYIQTSEEFNQLKADNIELFTQFIGFSWVLGKTKDSFLAGLQPFV